MDSFEIFKESKYLLPKVFLYFDDLNFSSKKTGELGAINNFNANNKLQIEEIPEMAETLSLFWKKWIFLGKRFFYYTIFITTFITKDTLIHSIKIYQNKFYNLNNYIF